MLKVRGLEAGYGDSQVLFGMDFEVSAGEVVTLLGRNGSGKSSTIRAVTGLLPPSAGSVVFEGVQIIGLPPYRVAQLGVGLVLEGRRVFPNLTVRENMIATARPPVDGSKPWWNVENAVSIFPVLGERLSAYGNQLSGGEQQMLAIARAMMTHPKFCSGLSIQNWISANTPSPVHTGVSLKLPTTVEAEGAATKSAPGLAHVLIL